MPSKNPYESLPFVGARKGPLKDQHPRDFWCNVTSTGDAIKDQDLGAHFARLALQAIEENDFSPLLGWIVRDMIENKCPTDIVVGFCHVVAGACMENRPRAGGDIPAPEPKLKLVYRRAD